jgi:anti-sigma regulatory factor (Ser/Thr protein kinase)
MLTELRRAADVAASDFQGAQVIVTELLTNALRYGSGPASYAFEWSGEQAVLHVWDYGPAFGWEAELPDATAESGRGLCIVQRLAMGLHVDRTPIGNHVRCVLPVTRQLAICA